MAWIAYLALKRQALFLGPFGTFLNLARSVINGGADVLAPQARVGVQEIVFARTFADLAQQKLDGNPRISDHRLPRHHTRIDLNAVRHASAASNASTTRSISPTVL